MQKGIKISYAKSKKDINYFWGKRDEYFLKDVIPNNDLGDNFTEDDIEWFFSKEYKNHIIELFEREIDPLYIAFINDGSSIIGFLVYVIYNSEDGKCFILDYCIFEQYRNNGIGKVAFDLLEDDFLNKGATYIDLNVSNINNERFWISNGFLKTDITAEENNFIYRKTL